MKPESVHKRFKRQYLGTDTLLFASFACENRRFLVKVNVFNHSQDTTKKKFQGKLTIPPHIWLFELSVPRSSVPGPRPLLSDLLFHCFYKCSSFGMSPFVKKINSVLSCSISTLSSSLSFTYN